MTNIAQKLTAKAALQRQRVVVTSRVAPVLYDWMAQTRWLAALSISKTVELAIQFSHDNEQDFKRFCNQQTALK